MPRGHDLDALATAITANTRVVFLANPNNPTGTWFGIDALSDFLRRVPASVLVVVDEAYAEFVDGGASALALLPAFPNLVVTRTFSKAYALAGLRVGFAVAHPSLIAVMERVRESFNVNCMGLAAAEAALGDGEHLRWSLARNAEERTRLAGALRERGRFVHPSMTNFLLVEFGADTARVEAALLDRGIVLRPMGGYGLPDCLRITIGDRDENRRLLSALDEIA
jgi:histidinol-phosphate aminotransferase